MAALQHGDLDIFACHRNTRSLPRGQSHHQFVAIEQGYVQASVRRSLTHTPVTTASGGRSSVKSSSALRILANKAEQPESERKGSRDSSQRRPPGLAATHPYKYLDLSPTKVDGTFGVQKNMPGHDSSQQAWTPITPESLPAGSMSPSPEPHAKPSSSSMGPPPIPRRRNPATQIPSPSSSFSSTNSHRFPSPSPSCSSTRCLPHTHLLDPMMQHSKSPTLWLYDANVDRRDTDLANGNVTSPLAMIGLPLGGMVEMAHYYPPDNGHRWQSSMSEG